MSILVVGGSGFVGHSLVAALSAAGVDVRAGSRHAGGTASLGGRWVYCDLEQPDTLPAALASVDVAYYLVHSMGKGRTDYAEVDRRCALNFQRAAAASNCRRIIYLGGVAPRGRLSEHLASRLEVGAILRAGTVPAVELRAAMIIGAGSASWRIMRDLAARLPFMVLPRWLDSRCCPIALADVISALHAARDIPVVESAWFDIPGPEMLSAREMLAIIADLDGRRIPSVRVPVLTPALSAMWLKLISGADYSLARELVLGLTEDLLPMRSFWPLASDRPRWSFRGAAAQALATDTAASPFARLVERIVHRIGPHAAKPV